MFGSFIYKIAFFFCLILQTFASTEKNYITCNFRGQIGNQLFQVAAAVAYGLDHNYKIRFPSIFSADRGNDNYRYFLHRIKTKPFPKGTQFFDYYESHYATYNPIPYEKNRNIRLNGHFVSEKYFIHHAGYIRDLFAPSDEILKVIRNKYGALLQEPTVAIHVRTFIPDGRNPSDFDRDSKCWWYFRDAMDYFPDTFHFVVFSDRMDIVKQNFPVSSSRKITFIEGNPYYIDFYLMSMCNHQIVCPGSTFSWWAAWLNKNPNKIVICSHIWSDRPDVESAIPPSWFRTKAWAATD